MIIVKGRRIKEIYLYLFSLPRSNCISPRIKNMDDIDKTLILGLPLPYEFNKKTSNKKFHTPIARDIRKRGENRFKRS